MIKTEAGMGNILRKRYILSKRDAHRIKGAAANLSCGSLQRIAHDMERAGRVGDNEELGRLSPELTRPFDHLREMFGNQPFMVP
jgi:HPt (histidine-containing phosphotransfer) domain-containing protein